MAAQGAAGFVAGLMTVGWFLEDSPELAVGGAFGLAGLLLGIRYGWRSLVVATATAAGFLGAAVLTDVLAYFTLVLAGVPTAAALEWGEARR